MKKLLAFLLALSLLLSASALADPGVTLCYRMIFDATPYNRSQPGALDFDSLLIDVWLMNDFTTAYYTKTTWQNGSVETTGLVRCTVSDGPDKKHALDFPNGERMYFYYDSDKQFWLEMDNGTYHLYPCEFFDLQKDLK